MNGLAKGLMILGALIFLSGAVVYAVSKLGLPFGRLPGDIFHDSGNFKIFAPVTSMIVVSVLLTIILNIISRFGK